MKTVFSFCMFFLGICIQPWTIYGQEEQGLDIEQSSEVFLEDYSDAFQESFFEGLKQKGIQNYDRAIIAFMECKRLEPENNVVDFELSKSFLLDKKFMEAQQYAIATVVSNPDNYWYAENLINIVEAKKGVLNQIKSDIPWENQQLRKNIAEIYYRQKDYQTAKFVLEDLKKAVDIDNLRELILDSIEKQKQPEEKTFTAIVENSGTVNAVDQYKMRLKGILKMDNATNLLVQISNEAIENYPSQPYFYYVQGYALNKMNKNKNAVEFLETALDYLVNDNVLENNIYKELVIAYNALSNPVKANMYQRKIKPGF